MAPGPGARRDGPHYQTISLITYLIISTYLITLLLSLLLAFFHETDCVNKLIISLIAAKVLMIRYMLISRYVIRLIV